MFHIKMKISHNSVFYRKCHVNVVYYVEYVIRQLRENAGVGVVHIERIIQKRVERIQQVGKIVQNFL